MADASTSTGMSTRTKIGIGVGVTLLVIAIIGVIVWQTSPAPSSAPADVVPAAAQQRNLTWEEDLAQNWNDSGMGYGGAGQMSDNIGACGRFKTVEEMWRYCKDDPACKGFSVRGPSPNGPWSPWCAKNKPEFGAKQHPDHKFWQKK